MSTIRYDFCYCCLKTKQCHQLQYIGGHLFCPDCGLRAVKQFFESALQHEIHYPPKWGGSAKSILNFHDYQDHFTPEFADAWRMRIREYETPVQHRVYCQQKPRTDVTKTGPGDANFCNGFIGATAEMKGVARCPDCGSWTCLECRCIVELSPDDHVCKLAHDDEPDSPSFNAETRRKEWQQCPNPSCSVKCALGERCNSLTCHFCSTEFCNFCGREASANDSSHWTEQQGCPRFGGFEAASPWFDLLPFDDGDFCPATGDTDFRVGMATLDNMALPPLPPDALSMDDDYHTLYDKLNMMSLWEDLDYEAWTAVNADADDTIRSRLMADMKSLIQDLALNLEWVMCEWTLRDEAFRAEFSHPVMEAVESVNFIIRHERIEAGFLRTFDAILGSAAPSSALVTHEAGTRRIFARYTDELQPRVAESIRLFVSEREVGRTLWVQGRRRVEQRA